MGAYSETYVDPSIDANSGSGTIGDPYGDLQYALNTMTRDSTNGDRINVKSGTSETITSSLSLASYGSPSASAMLLIEGYTSIAGDGGVGDLDLNGGAYQAIATTNNVYLKNLSVHNNSGANYLHYQGSYCGVQGCEFYDGSGGGVFVSSGGYCLNCNIHDIDGAYGIYSGGGASALSMYNYLKNGSTKRFTSAIYADALGSHVSRNIVSVDGSSNGIQTGGAYRNIYQNSVLSIASTGSGIVSPYSYTLVVLNNLIEGFRGAGGGGIMLSASQDASGLISNAVYDCETAYRYQDLLPSSLDNESLGASPFAKTGSDTFANRFDYFAPADTGNVLSAYPNGANLAKGAVQPASGGSAGMLRRSNWRGGY